MSEQTMIRLETELAELSEKVTKLDCFIGSESFYKLGGDSQWDLKHQLTVMREYKTILQTRIAKAKGWIENFNCHAGVGAVKGGD